MPGFFFVSFQILKRISGMTTPKMLDMRFLNFPQITISLPDTMQIVAGVLFFPPENWQDAALFSEMSGGMICLRKNSQIIHKTHRNEGILK